MPWDKERHIVVCGFGVFMLSCAGYLWAVDEPRNEFERIAEASRLAEVEANLSKPTTRLQRVLLALFLGVSGPLMLRLGRFTDGVSGPWWIFVLVGLACAALGYFVVPWMERRRR